MLLIYSDDKRWADAKDAERGAVHQEYMAVTQEMVEAGVIAGGDPLEAVTSAKTVSQDGVVTDGPHAEVAEHLGGYYILEVPSIDEATKWAAKLPGVKRGWDKIEVREVAVIEA